MVFHSNLKKSTASLLFALLLPVLVLGGNDKEKKPAIEWLEFSAAVSKSVKENKLLVVDFYTDWCTWCKVMDEKTYGNAAVIDFARKKLVMSKVNAESNEPVTYKGKNLTYRQLAGSFGVDAYPATVFVTPKGEFLTLVKGYIPPEKFLPILEFLEGGHYESMSFEDYLKKRNGAKSE